MKNPIIFDQMQKNDINGSKFYEYWGNFCWETYTEQSRHLKQADLIGVTRFAPAEVMLSYFSYQFQYGSLGITITKPTDLKADIPIPPSKPYSFTAESAAELDHFLESIVDRDAKAFKAAFGIAEHDQRKTPVDKLNLHNLWMQRYWTIRNLRQHAYTVIELIHGNQLKIVAPDSLRRHCLTDLYFDYGQAGLREIWDKIAELELAPDRALQGKRTQHDLTHLTEEPPAPLIAP